MQQTLSALTQLQISANAALPGLRARRGLSELTGAVILIAITLVAGVALYGLYFSGPGTTGGAASTLQGVVNPAVNNQQANSYYSAPRVTVAQVSCVSSDGACTIQLMNTGSSDATAYGCSIGGGTGALSPDPATITAGASATVTCSTQSGAGGGPGSMVSGQVLLTDGTTLPWSGSWQ